MAITLEEDGDEALCTWPIVPPAQRPEGEEEEENKEEVEEPVEAIAIMDAIDTSARSIPIQVCSLQAVISSCRFE